VRVAIGNGHGCENHTCEDSSLHHVSTRVEFREKSSLFVRLIQYRYTPPPHPRGIPRGVGFSRAYVVWSLFTASVICSLVELPCEVRGSSSGPEKKKLPFANVLLIKLSQATQISSAWRPCSRRSRITLSKKTLGSYVETLGKVLLRLSQNHDQTPAAVICAVLSAQDAEAAPVIRFRDKEGRGNGRGVHKAR
jgi:hypothetical protein